SPLPVLRTCSRTPEAIGGLFSVALSCGSPRLGVTQHPVLRSPDVPRTDHRSHERVRTRPPGRLATDSIQSPRAYLQRLPVDCLKIDHTFISALIKSTDSDALIHTLVQRGRDLGLRTLAEVTTDQIDQLRSERVDEAQGFLLARPLDPTTLEAQLLAPNRACAR
ncbi:MAG: hypothetical protein QOI08_2558, partial [Actinomycetota bacterium]|nr:hypothetical protein [Actinomycetota bacterium]